MSESTPFNAKQIIRIKNGKAKEERDLLIKEISYKLFVNSLLTFEFNCTPTSLTELGLGYLYSNGIIGSYEDVDDIRVDEESKVISARVKKLTSEGLMKKNKEQEFQPISLAQIRDLMRTFNNRCQLFQRTGASHAIALSDANGILYMEEDVARHNALEKVMGKILINKVDISDKILLFSGRVSKDMIMRVDKIQVKKILAVGAPTDSAVDYAIANNITICGFVREDRMNIYSHPQRINV